MSVTARAAWNLPGTVLLLDDDETFVRSLAEALEPSAVVAFTAPGPALRHLHTVAEAVGSGPVAVGTTEDAGIAEAVALRRDPLERFVRTASRFAMVTVAIVDQVMPAMPGTTFCAQARAMGVKTCLLYTSDAADEL